MKNEELKEENPHGIFKSKELRSCDKIKASQSEARV
jgi:hypothetical protein